MHSGGPRLLVVENERLQLVDNRRRASFGQDALRDLTIVDVGAAQQLKQFVVARAGKIESNAARRILVAYAVEPPFQPINARRIAVGVLIAVIAVVPVEDLETAVRAGLLRDRHEPCIIGP